MTTELDDQPDALPDEGPDDELRRRLAVVLRVGAIAMIIAGLIVPVVASVTLTRSVPSYFVRSMVMASLVSLVVPILLLIVSPGVARGGGGAMAAALVLSCLQTGRGLGGGAFLLLQYNVIPVGWSMLPNLVLLAVAGYMAVASIRLWLRERRLWPEPRRIVTARAAWKRARVALVIAWALIYLFAAACVVLGIMLFLEDPKGMGGGIGIVLLVFGALVTAAGVWLMILWIRLRRRGPIVARSTAWQIASILALWLLISSAGQGEMVIVSIFAAIPTAALAWMLIELLHASLARNASGDGVIGGFDVVALDDNIPIAQVAEAQPPPLPTRLGQ